MGGTLQTKDLKRHQGNGSDRAIEDAIILVVLGVL
jgi:hypothetical protein